jgi:hypothetical protein
MWQEFSQRKFTTGQLHKSSVIPPPPTQYACHVTETTDRCFDKALWI